MDIYHYRIQKYILYLVLAYINVYYIRCWNITGIEFGFRNIDSDIANIAGFILHSIGNSTEENFGYVRFNIVP